MVITDYGYKVTGDAAGVEISALPPIITAAQFAQLVPGLASTTERVEAVIAATSATVRAWCGWHISPVLTCEWIGEADGTVLMLPSMGIRQITALSFNTSGTFETVNASNYESKPSGMLRLKHGYFPAGWCSTKCTYKAGYEAVDVQQVVAQIAANALVAAPGVAEEHAGSVGITYNKTGDGVTGGVRLLESDYAALAPYRLNRAW